MDKINVILVTALLLVSSLLANDVVVQNYGHTNEVNAIASDGELFWVATAGGLVTLGVKDNLEKSYFHNPDDFPDINLTSLVFDENHNLWIGTYGGILHKRDKNGNQNAFHDLELNESRINVLMYHQGLLYVGHTKGVSVFETKSESYRGTAIQFGNLSGKSIVDIKIIDDTLYAVYDGNEGQVLQFPDVSTNVLSIAFSTPSSWDILEVSNEDKNVAKSISSIQFDGVYGIQRFEGPSTREGQDYIYAVDSSVLRARFVLDTISGKDTFVVVDSNQVNSEILCLHNERPGEVISGHKDNSLKRNPFKSNSSKYFSGLRKKAMQKLFLQSDGTLWAVPDVTTSKGALVGKNHLITVKDRKYVYYGDWVGGFGTIGKSFLFQGISEGPDGAMWFGNSGDFPKRFKNNKWQRLIIDHEEPYDQAPRWVSDNNNYGFTKIDAIHVDKNNVVWGSYWQYKVGDFPMFWVYDVKSEAFQFWGNMPLSALTAWKIVEGGHGHKMLSFRNDNTWGQDFLVIDGDADIFDSTQSFEDLIIDRDTLRGSIYDIGSSEKGTFIIATSDGFSARHYKQGELSFLKCDSTGVNVQSLAVGNSFEIQEEIDTVGTTRSVIRTDLWAGLYGSGIELYYLKEYIGSAGEIDSITVVKDNSFSMILEKERLTAYSPLSMVYDKKSDNLWVASKQGMSRIVLKRKTMTTETSEKFYLYPNPYRKKEHSVVTIKGVAKDAFVDVYTSSGQLVEHITKEGQFFTAEDENGIHYFQWRPSDKLAPGTYFVVAKNEERTDVVLQKLLILP